MDQSKFEGCVLGAAVGDALGMPVEMMNGCEIESRFGRITEFISPDRNPNMRFSSRRLQAGSWTDDTQRTFANVFALIESDGRFDMDLFASNFLFMYNSRENRGWGRSTRNSGARLIKGEHWSISGEKNGCGNGVIIGISPFGLLHSVVGGNVDEFIKNCITYARMTHLGTPAIVAGAVHGISIASLVRQRSPDFNTEFFLNDLLDAAIHIENDFSLEKWDDKISDQVRAIRNFMTEGRFDAASPYDVASWFGGGTSYSPNSFGVSYSLFVRKPNSFDCVFDAVNAGGDSDSNASIVGSLVGALNGVSVIPQNLCDGVEGSDSLRSAAVRLFKAVCARQELTANG